MMVRARRSLKASPEGIKRANKAVLSFATKIDFAAELEISRATVQNFFAGKPVGRENFHKICQVLELPWQEIADLAEDAGPKPVKEWLGSGEMDALVQEVRQRLSHTIQQCCGLMRVLDMSQPIGLNDIYTRVNVLEKISGRRRLEVADLLKVCLVDDFERPSLGRVTEERVSGPEAIKKYSKLVVLGKPGSGKTTFLKHIALQCSSGQLQDHLVPLFITLKDFAEAEQQPTLLEYIRNLLAAVGIVENSVAEQLLSYGRILVLLDGLDEVREVDCYRVLQEVRKLSTQFHASHFVITCRIATREYTLEQFTEVEITDFDSVQIATFVTKWFAAKDPAKGKKFVQNLRENCPIQELATNPLLLTLLCLVFQESASFPMNRLEVYREGLSVLLRKWDAKRNIKREQAYKQLSLFHKEELLSQIASLTFERGDYFFRQKEVEQLIADYIRGLPDTIAEPEALQLDSEAVLKSIEAQHGLLVERARGIYSFSHLTFHEYFTARDIVSSSDPLKLEMALKHLVGHLNEKRWREVFLSTVSMLRNANLLLQLMKQRIDALIPQDEQIEAFLTWASRKAHAATAPYKPATIRAFYLDIGLARTLNITGGTFDLARTLDPNLVRSLDCSLALDLALDRTLALDKILESTLDPQRALHRILNRAISRAQVVDCELEQSLQQLKAEISNQNQTGAEFAVWWKFNGKAWTEQLRAVIISYRNLGQDWQFSNWQRDILQQYYDANKLLVDCLNSDCCLTAPVRQEIESTLLLPKAEMAVTLAEEKLLA